MIRAGVEPANVDATLAAIDDEVRRLARRGRRPTRWRRRGAT